MSLEELWEEVRELRAVVNELYAVLYERNVPPRSRPMRGKGKEEEDEESSTMKPETLARWSKRPYPSAESLFPEPFRGRRYDLPTAYIARAGLKRENYPGTMKAIHATVPFKVASDDNAEYRLVWQFTADGALRLPTELAETLAAETRKKTLVLVVHPSDAPLRVPPRDLVVPRIPYVVIQAPKGIGKVDPRLLKFEFSDVPTFPELERLDELYLRAWSRANEN